MPAHSRSTQELDSDRTFAVQAVKLHIAYL